MVQQTHSYQQLVRVFQRVSHLSHMMAMLSWDEATMMPKGGADARGNTLGEITALLNETLSRPELMDWVKQAEIEPLTDWERGNLRFMKRNLSRVFEVDPALTEEMTRMRLKTETAWRECRPKNDFAGFLPWLKKIVDLAREEARQRGHAKRLRPYDALANLYDPGGRAEDYDRVFQVLREQLRPLSRTHELTKSHLFVRRVLLQSINKSN